MTLHGFLYDLTTKTAYINKYTSNIYKGHIQYISPAMTKNSKNIQYELEKLRPKIDYIILHDSSILVDYTENYSQLKQSALELTTKHLLDKQKDVLTAYYALLNITHLYKYSKPYTEYFPEQFI